MGVGGVVVCMYVCVMCTCVVVFVVLGGGMWYLGVCGVGWAVFQAAIWFCDKPENK